jgi:hypothetical protein
MSLFPELENNNWNDEWTDMPEFLQEDLKPFMSVIVHFKNKEDIEKFGKLVDHKFTYKTKSIWFPKFDQEKPSEFVYIRDEEDEK